MGGFHSDRVPFAYFEVSRSLETHHRSFIAHTHQHFEFLSKPEREEIDSCRHSKKVGERERENPVPFPTPTVTDSKCAESYTLWSRNFLSYPILWMLN